VDKCLALTPLIYVQEYVNETNSFEDYEHLWVSA